ncbi:hypothetical protein BHE74_00034037 [Ensete ventricosum]|nr:hypothetical protein GW17_00002494 [Ensete ventricosum]RWW59049.1 hypothetical protein BHE74_00034037 [Ensete ventricosum]RZR87656.1 hypothetical protein BHM03_00015110 [Ensete ventricosum]
MKGNAGPPMKVYHENCPGCKQDRKNEVHRGVPYGEFFFIWIVTLCSCESTISNDSFDDLVLVVYMFLTNIVVVSFLILHGLQSTAGSLTFYHAFAYLLWQLLPLLPVSGFL